MCIGIYSRRKSSWCARALSFSLSLFLGSSAARELAASLSFSWLLRPSAAEQQFQFRSATRRTGARISERRLYIQGRENTYIYNIPLHTGFSIHIYSTLYRLYISLQPRRERGEERESEPFRAGLASVIIQLLCSPCIISARARECDKQPLVCEHYSEEGSLLLYI